MNDSVLLRPSTAANSSTEPGGAPRAIEGVVAPHITREAIDVAALLDATESPAAGALVFFAGTVRNHNDGRNVTAIRYSAYLPLAEKAMAAIERETRAGFAITECRIRHRIGDLACGDISVLVVVRAAHRADAYAASRHAIDAVKASVPIWKHERYRDGSTAYLEGHVLAAALGADTP